MYDSHIHLDQYSDEEIETIVQQVDGVVAVATDLKSSQRLLHIRERFSTVHIAAGFHPEQPLLSDDEWHVFKQWIINHRQQLTAIGEIGLPHYLNREGKIQDMASYELVLERFIKLAAELELPVVLHAVYDDALTVLTLLEQYRVKRTHFHWFKASDEVLQHVIDGDYMMSVTPDVIWNAKTRQVITQVPLEQLMIETDGPWPHEGFTKTEIDRSLSAIIDVIAEIKGMDKTVVINKINSNTTTFYSLKEVHNEG